MSRVARQYTRPKQADGKVGSTISFSSDRQNITFGLKDDGGCRKDFKCCPPLSLLQGNQIATLHTLRHTFASWSVMGGLSLPQVGALLGHKSAQTTLRHADHIQGAVRQYSEQIAGWVSIEA